ncbi:unnamed protein product [Clonostachys byssicola]|uniref:Helicase C-terminal domain-containing protein n=1 Tax=Clonostachys byssicola TaxID=160290 RepID=A0A9N9U652_9HYPO|nr:unnamed protein product [Clonostachys byssicola]
MEIQNIIVKAVIFSFWKTTLDVVGDALEARGVKYLRVDGNVSPKKRNTILLDFQNRSAWRVLIMTFSTGSVGLNGLTVANRVHILEPQWNPAVESQAIGRFLRIGQRNKVTVVRYAMLRSIEEVSAFATDYIEFECHTLNWKAHFICI